jgi:hypothetical protein
MTLRTQKRLLWTLNAVLAAAIVGSAAGFLCWPLPKFDAGPAAPPTAPRAATAKDRPLLSAYAVIYQQDLLAPLWDVVETKAPPPQPAVTLAGTVIQPGFTYALLKNKAGEIKWVAVGQALDGAEVLEIAADSAVIRFGGSTYTLKIQKERSGP